MVFKVLGKTTTAGKLANLLRKQGKKPLLVACDVYRPAAIKQLQVVGAQLNIPVYSEENSKDDFRMITTDSRHIESVTPRDYRDVEPRRVLDYTTTTKANGNNVDAEQEAMEILKIQLNYQLLTQMQSFQFSQMKTVLK